MFWDASDAEGRTALQVAAATPLQALPATFGEGFGAAWDSALAEEQSISRARLETAAWQQVIDDARQKTGEDVGNPGGLGDMTFRAAFSDNPFERLPEDGGESKRRAARERLAALGLPVPTDQDIHDRMQKIADESAAALRSVQAGGGAGSWGAFAGAMAGVMADPPNVASLALGAPAGVGVLRTMAIEAGVNMGVEASNQVAVTALKQDLGRDYGVGDAALAVGMAGGGAAALTAIGHGAAATLRAFRKAKDVKPELGDIDAARAGETLVTRQAIAEETAPRPDFDGEEAHAAALDAMEAALNGGDPFRAPEYAAQVRRDIADLVAGVVADGAKGAELERVVYGRPTRDQVERLVRAGLDGEKLVSAPRAIHADGVAHALKEHATDAIPLRPEDIRLVPDVVFDGEFIGVTPTSRGTPGVTWRKDVGGSWLYVVEEVTGGVRQGLLFKTAYRAPSPKVKGRPEGRPSGTRAAGPLSEIDREANARSEGGGYATENIARSAAEINRGAPDFRPLPEALRAPGDGRKPVSLLEFLKREGGLRDEGGELAAFDLGKRRPGLVSKKGRPLDYARERATEAGYIPPEATINDFVDAVRREAGGAAVYRAEDVGAVEAWRGYENAVREAGDLLGGTDAARGLSDADYAHAIDVARGHRAWDSGPGKSSPISDAEAAGLVAAARTEGRPLKAVIDDAAEARARWVEIESVARADADEPIPFELEDALRASEAVDADFPARWREAAELVEETPGLELDWPWAEIEGARGRAGDMFELVDGWKADARRVAGCAGGVAA